jgi:Chemotaxis phosphatase CheX
MSSMKSLTTTPDPWQDPDAILAAVSAVTERSFFAVTEPCSEGRFKALADTASGWQVASVRFEEGPLTGSVACTLPGELARALFDAFTGRDPSDAAPAQAEIDDLVGEFANMVCGAWLSRIGGPQTFTLRQPVVQSALRPADREGTRLAVTVNDLPLAIDLTVQPALAPRA